MTYAATLRRQGQPPVSVPAFAADNDAQALAIVSEVAAKAQAAIWMIWESKNGMARQFQAWV